MNEPPQHELEPDEPDDRPRSGQLGFGTIALMAVFVGIIGAMCVGAAVILAVLFFK